MKNYLAATFAFLGIISMLLSCQPTKEQADSAAEIMVNQEILGDEGDTILVGKLNRAAWELPNYKGWFDEEYTAYEIDLATLDSIREELTKRDLLVFLGSWCSDSRREIPRLYKILDVSSYDFEQLQVVALDDNEDNYKKSPQHEEEGWDIEFVPTIIVLEEGKEIGRIVESPEESLELDLKAILF